MTESNKAVFLSYASEDAAVAQRICDALRAAGIEVWFDQSELRGGDAWDHKIREQVRECALFMPIISEHTQSRSEGYFRLEWDLADQRSHMITRSKAFIVPLCVDRTPDKGAEVPESFLKVQWTRLPGGEAPAGFCERVKALLGGEASAGKAPAQATPERTVVVQKKRTKWVVGSVAVVLLAIGGAGLVWRKMQPTANPSPAVLAAATLSEVFDPPPHSIAVLPFVNMSGDKEQEYFSEGLTEEVLNSLARLSELQVAARTSSFSFEGQHPDIATVAHKLNVGAVLEGSVRRAGHTVRITTQLVNGVTGFHLWSQTYDRDLKDVLKLQTEIANAVASALKVTLLGDVGAKIELGGTRNPAAFDAYLRASKALSDSQTEQETQAAIAGYTESIRLDPNYALAYADRSRALGDFATTWAKGPAVHDYLNKARSDAFKAIDLAPDVAEGHLALADLFEATLEFTLAIREVDRALALAPGNARVLRNYSLFAVLMGHTEASLSAAHRAVELDRLNSDAHFALGFALLFARRYGEAIVALTNAKALDPTNGWLNAFLGQAYYWSGHLQSARAACEESSHESSKEMCLALVYGKLGRHAEAQSMLVRLRDRWGDDDAEFYAMIYAEWGDTARALDSLETALRRRNVYLEWVKAGPWFDSLRKEPRFLAIERALKFPD